MKFIKNMMSWVAVFLYAPFYIAQRFIVYIDDLDLMKNASSLLKIIFAPEMLCETEKSSLLSNFYRLLFYIFWGAISFLAFNFTPSVFVDFMFASFELPYVVAASVMLYVSSYHVTDCFCTGNCFKDICRDNLCSDEPAYTKVEAHDEVGSRPNHTPRKKSNHNPGFKYSRDLSPVKNDTEDLHESVDAHNRNW